MVMAQKRHGKRPAHIHFLISAPGYRELVTALYLAGDEHLEDDVVFGASGDLVVEVKDNDPASPDQRRCPASTSTSAWRARARPTGAPAASAPTRARSRVGQRQGDRPLRRPAPGDAGRRAAEEDAASWAACSAEVRLDLRTCVMPRACPEDPWRRILPRSRHACAPRHATVPDARSRLKAGSSGQARGSTRRARRQGGRSP